MRLYYMYKMNKKRIEKDIEICDIHTNNAISYMDIEEEKINGIKDVSFH